jgi:flagellar motility protein MotE (MotC chaperone)
MSGLRLLPAAALAAGLLLAMKALGLADPALSLLGAGEARAEEAKAEPPPEEKAAEGGEMQEPDKADAASDPALSNLPTASESDVIEALKSRREQLDARERELDMKEKSNAAVEKRIEERIAELKRIEQNIQRVFGERDEKAEKRIADLVKTYETMKPADAAQIFDTLEQQALLDVMSRIKPAKASAILAAMKPQRAQEVTVLLLRQFDIPEAADAEPAEAPVPEAGGGT